MSGGQGPSRDQQFAVISRRVVFVGGSALLIGGVLAILNGQVVLGIALTAVTFLAVAWRGSVTLRRGQRALAEAERAEVPEGAVRDAGAPAPVEDVVAQLVGMNSDGLPYQITASRSPDGVRVEVQWKHEEMRWQTLFVRGSQAFAWRMEVDLDPAMAHYKFVEHSGKASVRAAAGPMGVTAYGNWTWQKGKTSGGTSATFVEGADGQVTVAGPAGPRTSWEGAVMIKPADAKVPVFTVLRNNGWRPRRDWAGARLFEK
ncbi:hypothetical protein L1785_17720 [Antribacter sp. KLBMP9083]|uniref:DUF4178 domain-containing protein n=1 Tax=Antribacter soli TaxID=2910976 RepID=A0AA41U8A8_9MICO|nr:hypothetical protein [Antribacter soli]MCF4122818.1 hypothetical protein [Antribacter soli]